MKKSIVKTSLLIGLSTLFTACGSNHTPTSQPQSAPQSNLPNTPPKNEQMHNNSEGNKQEVPSPMTPSSNEEDKPVPPTYLPNKEQNPSQAENDSDTNVDANQNESQRENNTAGNNIPIDQSNEMNLDHTQNHHQMPPAKMQNNTESNSKKLNEESLNTHWLGDECEQNIYCIDNEKNPIQILNKNSHNHTLDTMSLTIGENEDPQKNYKFILLGENNTGAFYYGHYLNKEKNGYELLTGGNTTLINENTLSESYNATYKKQNGFLYTKFKTDNTIQQPKYADVFITYKDGKASGQITESNNTNNPLFKISDGNAKYFPSKLIITPTGENKEIPQDDNATFTVFFYDSKKGQDDRKYITGRGAGKNWRGILAAEKQDPSTTNSGK